MKNTIGPRSLLTENETTYFVFNKTLSNLYIKINGKVSMENWDIVVPALQQTTFPKCGVKKLSFLKEDIRPRGMNIQKYNEYIKQRGKS